MLCAGILSCAFPPLLYNYHGKFWVDGMNGSRKKVCHNDFSTLVGYGNDVFIDQFGLHFLLTWIISCVLSSVVILISLGAAQPFFTSRNFT